MLPKALNFIIYINIMISLGHLNFADASNMCIQTVFTAIDHLTAWANGKSKAAAVRRVKGVPQKGLMFKIQSKKIIVS